MGDDCVDTDTLAAMIAGELPADRIDAIVEHVDACPVCAEIVAELGKLKLDHEPRLIGRYELGRVIGAGAMGVVHEAWDPRLQRNVAIKLLHPERSDEAARERMLREARALARVQHPNVVAVHDVSEHGDDICIATELVDGQTLLDWQRGRSTDDIVRAYVQAARGLAAAHACGIIHRDVKPANLLVSRDGRVRVGDFGLAHLASEGPQIAVAQTGPSPSEVSGSIPPSKPRPIPNSAPRDAIVVSVDRDPDGARSTGDPNRLVTNYTVGTPAYMAPEQLAGAADARSDEYSLCIALGEALTGSLHVRGDEPAFVANPPLCEAVTRGTRANPHERWASLDELADALTAAITPPPKRRGFVLATVGAVVAASAVIGVVAWPTRGEATCDPLNLPAQLWSPAHRSALGKIVPEPVLARIDRWVTGWSAMAGDVCKVDRDDSVMHARRDRCLTTARDALSDMLARWDLDTEYRYDVHAEVEDLPFVTMCAHEPMRHAIDPTAEQLEHMVGVHMTRRDATRTGKDYDATKVANVAKAIGYVPLAVETLVEASRRNVDRHRRDAEQMAREAVAIADASTDLRSQVISRIQLIRTLTPERVDEATKIADDTHPRIGTLGAAPDLSANLDDALAKLTKVKRPERAIAIFERARREMRDAYGVDSLHEALELTELVVTYHDQHPAEAATARREMVAILRRNGVSGAIVDSFETFDDPSAQQHQVERAIADAEAAKDNDMIATMEWTLGSNLVIQGKNAEALPHYVRAALLGDKIHHHDGQTAGSYTHAASLMIDAGRARDAIPLARRALAIAGDLHDDSVLESALETLSRALLAVGEAVEARGHLDKALVLLSRLRSSATNRGMTRFRLARALYDSDPQRALELASAAHTDITTDIDEDSHDAHGNPMLTPLQQRNADAIKAWIESHRRS